MKPTTKLPWILLALSLVSLGSIIFLLTAKIKALDEQIDNCVEQLLDDVKAMDGKAIPAKPEQPPYDPGYFII